MGFAGGVTNGGVWAWRLESSAAGAADLSTRIRFHFRKTRNSSMGTR